jgi:hypothetical protein
MAENPSINMIARMAVVSLEPPLKTGSIEGQWWVEFGLSLAPGKGARPGVIHDRAAMTIQPCHYCWRRLTRRQVVSIPTLQR